MVWAIGALKQLDVLTDDDGNGRWIYLQSFLKFLREHHRPTDVIKEIKRCNITKELKGHIGGLKEINSQVAVAAKSILRYIFHHAEHLFICQKLVDQIEKKCHDNTSANTYDLSIKEIYKQVVKTEYRNLNIEKYILNTLSFQESEIETLFVDYKNDFSEGDWKKICLFEHHFSNSSFFKAEGTYENIVEQRRNFLSTLQNCHEIQSLLLKSSKNAIIERTKRKQIDETNEAISVIGRKRHYPELLETLIPEIFPDNSKIHKLICLDCTSVCQHSKALHIYIEIDEDVIFEDYILLISSYLLKDHEEKCGEIVFLQPGTLDDYTDKYDKPARFEFRDDLLLKKVSNRIIFVWNINSQDEVDVESDSAVGNCQTCYSDSITKPLNMKTFDNVTEWSLNVPIFGQLFLETFINEKSFRRSENLDKFASSKLKKMYGCFDTLLNLLNKNYIRLLQDINSQELAMNYRSISTVFSVTSTSGATLSLNESEQRLKEKASSDLCYYNTYLKKHAISYESFAGLTKKELSIRDCILILMMDNLVRLKYHNDPDPGESRSMQICTLPITVKGMPKDALIVESWHDEQICDGTDSCICKEDKQLTKEDLEDLVLTLSPAEVEVKYRFQQLMTWGYANLLTEAFDNGIWNTLAVQTVENPDTTLETSFASLKMDDEDDTLPLYADEMAISNDLDQLNEMENENFLGASSLETPASELHIDEEEETFEQIFESRNINVDDLEQESNIDLNHSNMSLDDSFNFTSLNFEEDDESHTEGILNTLHFTMFQPPPLLARHPPPATGKDDDILKLKEILDDILVKTDHINMQKNHEKILFGPDNKIGSNLLKLRETNQKYQHFLPEFPLLHLRKSKINNLCSAYQHAGIVHIFKYMRDDNVKEWKKLINPDNIDKATRYIRRLSLSLHLAFICKFMQTLSIEDAEVMQEHITNKTIFGTKWETDFGLFMEKGKADNATFALHVDMMDHSDEVCAIAFAERLGGEAGYNLLLSAVKTSLPFSFLNGASSYAAYCTKLLHEHFKSGPFYRRMKTTLFTTPHKGSNVNFALDSQREMDHQDVIKAFRSGATVTSVIPRMSLIDTLNEVHDLTVKNTSGHNISSQEKSQEELLGIVMSETDIKYILRMTSLILRRDGISTEKNLTVFNVYELSPEILPESVLDETTKEVGRYLIKKFVAENNLFGYTKSDIPPKAEVKGPSVLIQRLKQSKGVTIRRVPVKKKQSMKSERDMKEDKRKKEVTRKSKQIDRLSSEMNTCQAIVKPDCSKPKVQKATGIQKALMQLLVKSMTQLSDKTDLDLNDGKLTLENNNLITLSSPHIPVDVQRTVKFATLEFAGFKFSSFAHTGREYLHHIEQNIIKIKHQLPCLKHLVICEEKYKFTPDDFKAATRAQRKVTTNYSISHLKTSEEVLSSDKFDKPSLVGTSEGKSLASTYLAKNVEDLRIKENITIDVDSELHITTCYCTEKPCKCSPFCTPVRAYFDARDGFTRKELLHDIKQCKGEAEMSQIDWLINCPTQLLQGDSCASIVSSGDIDAVVLHLFTLSHLWPKNENASYKNTVYVILKKANHMFDIYNITAILETLEKKTLDKHIGIKVAIALSLGGNDFLPKFHSISHSTKLDTYMNIESINQLLIQITEENNKVACILFDTRVYKEYLKHIYCPKNYSPVSLTYQEVRQISIQLPSKKQKDGTRNPQLWLPPESVVERLARNVSCLIKYYLSAGNHSAQLPDFLTEGCLVKTSTGEIEYDFGDDAYVKDIHSVITIPQEDIMLKISGKKKTTKRKMLATPQKGRNRKMKPKASTPKKSTAESGTSVNNN